jgi:hypothetical protein
LVVDEVGWAEASLRGGEQDGGSQFATPGVKPCPERLITELQEDRELTL